MASILHRSAPGTGGGGGGLTITGFDQNTFSRTTAFVAGALRLELANVPVTEGSIQVFYNGQQKTISTEWTYDSGTNEVVIGFGDPYVPTYDDPVIFLVSYAY